VEYAVSLEGICKSFSRVQVLDNVDFHLKPGEIHALVGENGAGKSTLIKILSGALIKDSGIIRIEDKEVDIQKPLDAKMLGVQCIYQELSLIPHLSVANNIFLGMEKHTRGFTPK
jgi:ribose transport system ATP-binding protein